MANLSRGVLLSLAVSAVIAELTSALGLKLIGRSIYWIGDNPIHWSADGRAHATDGFISPLRTEKDPWGVWGVPGSRSRLVRECFDVKYEFNGIGARDKEIQLHSSKRWIVLGDSFVEGWGIQENERFTNILEGSLGLEFANFASSGDFGPLQYLLVYKFLAKQFQHNGVIIGFLPANDFTDNDSEWWRQHRTRQHQYRYRPYSVISTDYRSYRIIYGVNNDATPRNDFNTPPLVPKLRTTVGIPRGLSEVSATFSLMRQLSSEWTLRKLRKSNYEEGYFTTDQREIAAVKLVFDDLLREIGKRPKMILLFPTHADLVERRRRGVPFSNEVTWFVDGLRSDGWAVVDTADVISKAEGSGSTTLGCDDHWNVATNRNIAEFLLSQYRKDLIMSTPRSTE
jgi:hypothetical protein